MIYLAIAIAIILQCQNYSSCGMLRRPGQWPLTTAPPACAMATMPLTLLPSPKRPRQ